MALAAKGAIAAFASQRIDAMEMVGENEEGVDCEGKFFVAWGPAMCSPMTF
jgi:hypothetical protein